MRRVRNKSRLALEAAVELERRGIRHIRRDRDQRREWSSSVQWEDVAVEFPGVTLTSLYDMRRLLREAPNLAQRVLDGEVGAARAFTILTKGEQEPCPTCQGHGFVYRRYQGG